MAQLLRRKSKVLVAFGSCAHEGCIPGLANLNNREEIFDTVYQETALDREPAGRPAAARDRGARGHAPPAGLLRHAARRSTRRCAVDYYLPGCPPEADRIWDGDRGDPRGQAAAAGLGDRRRHHRLRRVPAEAEREEDQEVLPHLGDHSRRGDVPAGAGAAVLRDRHPGRLRRPCPQVNSPCIGCYGPNDGVRGLRGPADDRPGLGDRLQRPGGDRPDHPARAFPTRSGTFLPLQPGRTACCGAKRPVPATAQATLRLASGRSADAA